MHLHLMSISSEWKVIAVVVTVFFLEKFSEWTRYFLKRKIFHKIIA